jgi:CheY-like chemotaxis protein/signal transduction histidine kinase
MSARNRTDAAELGAEDLHQILDAVNVGVLTVDAAGTILIGNAAAARMFGVTPPQLAGHALSRYLPDVVAAGSAADWLLRTTQAPSMTSLRGAGGRCGVGAEMEARVIELRSPPTRRYSVILSVPAADTAARVDPRRTRRLEILGRLVGGVAHDFNNLLMGVDGCIDVSLNKLDAAHAARKYLLEAKRSIVSGASTTRQLLAFSRRHKAPVGSQPLDKLVKGSIEFLRRLIAANLELEFTPAAHDCRILFPEGALEEILVHLVLQVRDVLPEGGRLTFESGVATVIEQDDAWLAGVPCGSYLTLRVGDEGMGGFDDPASEATLASVGEMVRQSGGYFELSRIPELETAVVLYLPRANPPPNEMSEPAPSETAGEGGAFVLIVDDEPMIRMALRSLLERIGYRVLEAHDGASALSVCRQREPIDVLLTDVVLPGIQGRQLAREVQALRPRASVVFMSAYPADTLVHDGRLEPGMISLRKPFDESSLAAALRLALERRGPAGSATRMQ